MSLTEIRHCSCKHEYQDQKYGKQMRLHNIRIKRDNKSTDKHGSRCTVCGTVKGE